MAYDGGGGAALGAASYLPLGKMVSRTWLCHLALKAACIERIAAAEAAAALAFVVALAALLLILAIERW